MRPVIISEYIKNQKNNNPPPTRISKLTTKQSQRSQLKIHSWPLNGCLGAETHSRAPYFDFRIPENQLNYTPPPPPIPLIHHHIRCLIWTVRPVIISEYNKNQKNNNPPPTRISKLTTKQSQRSQLEIHSWPQNGCLGAETHSRAPYFDFRIPENQLNYTPPLHLYL